MTDADSGGSKGQAEISHVPKIIRILADNHALLTKGLAAVINGSLT